MKLLFRRLCLLACFALGTLAAAWSTRAAVLQSFDHIFIGDDPSESFTFTQPLPPAAPSTLRFSGFVESLDLFEETGVRFLMGWGVTNNLEESRNFPDDEIHMGVRLPPVDPVKGPVRVPLEWQASLGYGPALLRFDVEGLGCCDNFRLVGNLTLEFEPRLRIAPLGAAARINWTTNWAGYHLESATTLPASTWTSVTNAASTVGADYSVTVETAGEQRVYRLRKP